MKLRISDLTDAGIDVDGEISHLGLNARINNSGPSEESTLPPQKSAALSNDTGIVFTNPVQIRMRARRTAGGAELSGTLLGSYTQGCGRCAQPITRSLDMPTTFVIKPRTRSDEIDDLGILYFSGDSIDLESPLQDTILLSLSLYWSPDIDPATGACIGCDKPIQIRSATPSGSSKTSASLGKASNSTSNSGGVKLGDLLKKLPKA